MALAVVRLGTVDVVVAVESTFAGNIAVVGSVELGLGFVQNLVGSDSCRNTSGTVGIVG